MSKNDIEISGHQHAAIEKAVRGRCRDNWRTDENLTWNVSKSRSSGAEILLEIKGSVCGDGLAVEFTMHAALVGNNDVKRVSVHSMSIRLA